MPFFLMAGWIWQVAIADAVLLPVIVITYAGYRGIDPISAGATVLARGGLLHLCGTVMGDGGCGSDRPHGVDRAVPLARDDLHAIGRLARASCMRSPIHARASSFQARC